MEISDLFFILYNMRTCNCCNIEKVLTDFTGGRNKCKSCSNKIRYQQKVIRRREDPEYDKQYKAYEVQRQRKRESTNELAGIKQKFRNNLRGVFKRKGYKKGGKSFELLGAEWEVVKAHFESLFQEGMTWENQGKWHIDHIIPIHTGNTEQEIRELCHYKNLQPLWADDNWKKGGNIL